MTFLFFLYMCIYIIVWQSVPLPVPFIFCTSASFFLLSCLILILMLCFSGECFDYDHAPALFKVHILVLFESRLVSFHTRFVFGARCTWTPDMTVVAIVSQHGSSGGAVFPSLLSNGIVFAPSDATRMTTPSRQHLSVLLQCDVFHGDTLYRHVSWFILLLTCFQIFSPAPSVLGWMKI